MVHPDTGRQVQAIPPAVAAKAGVPTGLYVQGVTAGSSAARAGSQAGDIITEINGQPAVSAEQVTVATIGQKPGDTLTVTYERDGHPTTATLTLT